MGKTHFRWYVSVAFHAQEAEKILKTLILTLPLGHLGRYLLAIFRYFILKNKDSSTKIRLRFGQNEYKA